MSEPIPSKRKAALTLLAWAVLPLSALGVMGWHMWQNYDWSPRQPQQVIRRDPIEFNPFIQSDLRAAEKEAAELVNKIPLDDLHCYRGRQSLFWLTKQRILRDKYGITWRTPAEMNPNVAF